MNKHLPALAPTPAPALHRAAVAAATAVTAACAFLAGCAVPPPTAAGGGTAQPCLLYTSPSPRD